MRWYGFPQIGDKVFVRDSFNERGYFRGTVVGEAKGWRRRITGKAGDAILVPEEGVRIRHEDDAEGEGVITATRLSDEPWEELFPSEEAVVAAIEAELTGVRHISTSRYVNQNVLNEYMESSVALGFYIDPVSRLKDAEEQLLFLLQNQYGLLEASEIYDAFGEERCVDFLNGAMKFYASQRRQGRHVKKNTVSADTMSEFLTFAAQTMPRVSAEPMTLRKFLRMCCVAYDAAHSAADQPPGASDMFVLCDNRNRKFRDDFAYLYENLGNDWDSPDAFHRIYHLYAPRPYHIEELRFGGPVLRLDDTGSEIISSGSFDYRGYNRNTAADAIRMYVALRKAGYPVICSNPDEIIQKARR